MRVIYVLGLLWELLWGLVANPIVWLLLAIAGCVYVMYLGEQEWKRFAEINNCRVISEESGTVAFASNGNGGGTVYVPGKTGYLCDDGVTYYR